MVRIVADTSTMYSTEAARAAGFDVAPLAVTIAGKTYKELDEIQLDEFVSIIGQGHMPVSSQPALGDVIAMYERCGDDEVLNISMADGLSGTYSTAVAAAQNVENSKIEVIDTGTLCGPHRYMVEAAAKMAQAGATLQQIKDKVHALIEKADLAPDTVIYMDYGSREMANHEGMRPIFAAAAAQLMEKGAWVTSRIVPNGDHCEACWEEQLPFIFDTLLYNRE